MKKVLTLALLLALIVTAAPALASGQEDRIAGEIISLDGVAGTITIQPPYGDPVTIQTSAETEFYRQIPQGGLEVIAFGDLAVGDRIVTEGEWAGDLFNAEEVVVVSSATSPPPATETIHGVITALDAVSGTITVQTPTNAVVTVQTSPSTEFYRARHHGNLEPITFSDLAVGDGVRATGEWAGDLFNADRVIDMPTDPPPQPEVVNGVITALDAVSETITVQVGHDGSTVLIQTSDETEFYRAVHPGCLEEITFADLAVGDRIGAEGEWEDGLFEAEKVVLMPSDSSSFETVEGVITALDAVSKTITVQDHHDGSAVTVQTSDETDFYRMSNYSELEEISFDDLTVGSQIVVTGTWDGDVFDADKVVVMSQATQQRARILPVRARLQAGQGLARRR